MAGNAKWSYGQLDQDYTAMVVMKDVTSDTCHAEAGPMTEFEKTDFWVLVWAGVPGGRRVAIWNRGSVCKWCHEREQWPPNLLSRHEFRNNTCCG